ncbi:MAG: hypothetical protein ACXWH0_05450 [Acidimicrobiia bacterium]
MRLADRVPFPNTARTATTAGVVTDTVTVSVDEVLTVTVTCAVGAMAPRPEGAAQVVDTVTVGVDEPVAHAVAVGVDVVVVHTVAVGVGEPPGMTVARLRPGTDQIADSVARCRCERCGCHDGNKQADDEEETDGLLHDVVPFSNMGSVSITDVERPWGAREVSMKHGRRSKGTLSLAG